MKIDAYSENREAHAHFVNGEWVIYPQEFAAFVETYELPDLISVAEPGSIEPDIHSKDGSIAAATWRAIMEEYLSVDEPPREFEFRDIPESDEDAPADVVY